MPGCRRVRSLFGLCLVFAAGRIRTSEALANFHLHGSHRSPQSFFLLSPLQERGERKEGKSRNNERGFPSRMEASSGDLCEDGSNRRVPSDDILADEDLDEYCEVVDDFGSSAFEKFSEGEEDEGDFQWIRLENRVDGCLDDIREKEDVVRRIRQVKELQEKSGRSELYSRQWHYRQSQVFSGEGDVEETKAKEQFMLQEPVNGAIPTSPSDDNSFSVLQFNMLAEGLSAGPSAQIPFQNNVDNRYSQSEEQSYGGFTDIPHPKMTMDFALRRWRLLEVILGSDGSAPYDLIAVEEIDRYRGFFAPVMRLFGYKGIFMPKTRSPCVQMGWYSDGCAIFWKSQLFELLSERRIEYKVGSQIGIIAALRHRPTKRPLLFAATHLKAQRSATSESIRAAQVDELLSRVAEEAETLARRERIDKKIPILMLGDFNADPPAQSSDSNEDVSSVKQVLTFHKSDLSQEKDRQRFQSAYPIDPSKDGFYTSWKIRGTKTSKRIIDYIFYSDTSLECRATLAVPSEEELEPSKLPGLRYPSDHMAIAAIMKLLEEE